MPLKNLRSTVSGHVPASLAEGQFGFNEADGIMFVNNAAGQVVGYNLAQLVAALSAPRPIALGGTGATTAAQALAALGGQAAATAAQADDVRQLMIQVAKLQGKVIGYASGFADDYQDQSGVDATSSVNALYDPTNKLFSNTGTEAAQSLPAMTSDSAPSGYTDSATAVYGGGYEAFRAFDQSAGSFWSAGGTAPQSIQRTLPSAAVMGAYQVTNQNNSTSNPTGWQLWGSNDGGTTKTVLDTQTGQSTTAGLSTRYQISTSNQGSFTTYGMTITGGSCVLAELALFKITAGALDLRSVAVSASIVPGHAGIFVLAKPLAGSIITPNTNLIASLSRTGSASPPAWTPVMLAAAGTVGGFTAYEANAVDISAQPSGSSMRTRLQTSGGLALQAQANVMQWAP